MAAPFSTAGNASVSVAGASICEDAAVVEAGIDINAS
jgi:uncharacterized protein with beta-barrel porin domain